MTRIYLQSKFPSCKKIGLKYGCREVNSGQTAILEMQLSETVFFKLASLTMYNKKSVR